MLRKTLRGRQWRYEPNQARMAPGQGQLGRAAGRRSLTIFPVLSFVAAATAFALIMAPGIVVAAAAEQEWVALPFFLVASYLATSRRSTSTSP